MFSATHKIIFKIAISLLFLIYVVVKVDLTLMYEALLVIKPVYYVVSFLFIVLNSVVLAQKYKVVMKPSGIYQSLPSLIKINYLCRFYSMFLPTAIGQSVIRWHLSTKNQKGRLKFIAVMFFERSTFFFALCLAVVLSFLFVTTPKVKEVARDLYPLLSLTLFGFSLFYLYLNSSPVYNFVDRAASTFSEKTKSELLNKFYEFTRSFSIYHKKKDVLMSSMGLALIWHLLFLLRVYFLIISIQVPLGFVHLSWMASLVLFLQVMPISINGIGLTETAYAYLFQLQDLPPEKGVLLGLLFFSQMLLMSGIGGVLHLLSKE